MKASKLFFALSVVFFAIGAVRLFYGENHSFALLGLGSLFLAFGLGRRKGESNAI